MKTLRIAQTLAALTALAALTGCGDDDDSLPVLGPDDVIIDEGFALGEDGCRTVSEDVLVDSNYCGTETRTSPDATYDHGSSCPHQYVAEYHGSVGYIAHIKHGWGDTLPTNQTVCENSFYSIGAYSYVDGDWEITRTGTEAGIWNGSSCSFPQAQGVYFESDIDEGSRLAVKAWWSTIYGPVKRKARASVGGTPCFGE